MTITFEVRGPDRLAELHGPLHELYRLCFVEPPWHETPEQLDAHPESLARDLAQPGASAIVALDGSTLAAAIYGWPAPEHPTDEPIFRGLAASHHRHVLAPAIQVAELMVHPRYRRRGLARRLLDGFVDDHPKAWLVTHPDAPARVLYESSGWLAITDFANGDGLPRVLYTRTVSAPEAPGTGSTARIAVPESSLR